MFGCSTASGHWKRKTLNCYIGIQILKCTHKTERESRVSVRPAVFKAAVPPFRCASCAPFKWAERSGFPGCASRNQLIKLLCRAPLPPLAPPPPPASHWARFPACFQQDPIEVKLCPNMLICFCLNWTGDLCPKAPVYQLAMGS